MQNLFTNVPRDMDTTILSQRQIKVGGIDALHQQWRWDGIRAESLIFVSSHITHLSPEAMKELLLTEGLVVNDLNITMSSTDDGYTFINFNFRT